MKKVFSWWSFIVRSFSERHRRSAITRNCCASQLTSQSAWPESAISELNSETAPRRHFSASTFLQIVLRLHAVRCKETFWSLRRRTIHLRGTTLRCGGGNTTNERRAEETPARKVISRRRVAFSFPFPNLRVIKTGTYYCTPTAAYISIMSKMLDTNYRTVFSVLRSPEESEEFKRIIWKNRAAKRKIVIIVVFPRGRSYSQKSVKSFGVPV